LALIVNVRYAERVEGNKSNVTERPTLTAAHEFMKLRDLTPEQIKDTQSRCDKEFEEFWKVATFTSGFATAKDIWRRAWSNGLKAGLEYAK